ncbi:MAG: Tfp pilus assembly protein FimT/FimU [Alphaproteobacteria bacterium]
MLRVARNDVNDDERNNIAFKGLDAVRQYTLKLFETAESGVDKVVSSCEKNPSVHGRYMNFLRQRKTALDAPLYAVSAGRSMIEMLGVLAIIAVLTVGGIAGYSKAMEKFKLNKIIGEYSMFLYNMMEHLDDLHRLAHETTQSSQVITEELYAMNIVPDIWSQESIQYFKDSMGNSVSVSVAPYMDTLLPDRLSVSIYLGGLTNTNSAGFTANLCTSFFTDILIPLQSTLIDAKLFRHKNGFSQEWAGSAYCTASRKCLSNMTLSDIHELCSSCDSKNDICQINFNI